MHCIVRNKSTTTERRLGSVGTIPPGATHRYRGDQAQRVTELLTTGPYAPLVGAPDGLEFVDAANATPVTAEDLKLHPRLVREMDSRAAIDALIHLRASGDLQTIEAIRRRATIQQVVAAAEASIRAIRGESRAGTAAVPRVGRGGAGTALVSTTDATPKDAWTKRQILDWLTARGVAADEGETKGDLLAKAEEAEG